MAWRARPLHTQSASTSPTTSENLAAGYRAGSRWTRVDTGQQWYLTDPAAGTWLSIPSGGVDAISVNGSAVVNGDFDDATPAAPGGAVNVTWQKDASSPANISAYIGGATTTARGVVELATDREDAANVVVQGNDTRLVPFVGSGASHATGLVPDPGAVAGTTKFLREDATWQTPAGGAGVWGTASTDLGAAASGSFTITDAAITTSSRVIVQWVSPTDEGQFDAVLPSPRLPATGSVVVEWRTTGGPVASGTHTFWYSVG